MSNSKQNKQHQILSVVARIVVIIFAIEALLMLLFEMPFFKFNASSLFWIDPLLLSLFSTPLIYLFVLKPFVNERDIALEKVKHMALHDHLTGLPNRRLFSQYIERSIQSLARYNRFGALIYLDLDDFKPINDSYSHEVGDQVLCAVANRLVKSSRSVDMVFRIGGDEFAILIEDAGKTLVRAKANMENFANKILGQIEKPIVLESDSLKVSCSLGIRVYNNTSGSVKSIVHEADSAMYEAKNSEYPHIVISEM